MTCAKYLLKNIKSYIVIVADFWLVAWSNGYDFSFTKLNVSREGSEFDPPRDYFFLFALCLLHLIYFALDVTNKIWVYSK